MVDYFYLLASFPSVELNSEPPISFHSLMWRLEMNLEEKDFEKIKDFLRYFDLLNLRAFWQKKTLDPWGNLDEKGIEEALLVETEFPEFVFDYLKKYKSDEERCKFFPELLLAYYSYMIERKKGFIQVYFIFQKTIRFLISEKKIEKGGKEKERELFFADLKDIALQEILQKSDSYEDLNFDYRPLVKLIEEQFENPMGLFNGLMEFQFSKITELALDSMFSIDKILQYLALLRIATEVSSLDQEKGEQIIGQIA
jgi:hypothetical protein